MLHLLNPGPGLVSVLDKVGVGQNLPLQLLVHFQELCPAYRSIALHFFDSILYRRRRLSSHRRWTHDSQSHNVVLSNHLLHFSQDKKLQGSSLDNPLLSSFSLVHQDRFSASRYQTHSKQTTSCKLLWTFFSLYLLSPDRNTLLPEVSPLHLTLSDRMLALMDL